MFVEEKYTLVWYIQKKVETTWGYLFGVFFECLKQIINCLIRFKNMWEYFLSEPPARRNLYKAKWKLLSCPVSAVSSWNKSECLIWNNKVRKTQSVTSSFCIWLRLSLLQYPSLHLLSSTKSHPSFCFLFLTVRVSHFDSLYYEFSPFRVRTTNSRPLLTSAVLILKPLCPTSYLLRFKIHCLNVWMM